MDEDVFSLAERQKSWKSFIPTLSEKLSMRGRWPMYNRNLLVYSSRYVLPWNVPLRICSALSVFPRYHIWWTAAGCMSGVGAARWNRFELFSIIAFSTSVWDVTATHVLSSWGISTVEIPFSRCLPLPWFTVRYDRLISSLFIIWMISFLAFGFLVTSAPSLKNSCRSQFADFFNFL